ncbi:MAG: NTP transferase domain-containing protein [Dehalococcoidia bacterium]|tara:strand:- start:4415 stop:5026 length:612 start_codon:yes stop_codon:yes gene_type:complete
MATSRRIAALLLSAGLSSRMHRHKALVDWGGRSLLRYQVDTLLQAGLDQIVVVLGANQSNIRPEIDNLDNITVVVNQDFENGKTTSITTGAEALQELAPDDLMILNVDQPRSAEIIQDIVRFHNHSKKGITIPRFKSKGGHPIVLSASYLDDLKLVKESTLGLKQLMLDNADDIGDFFADSEEILIDMNTEAEYNSAKLFFGI